MHKPTFLIFQIKLEFYIKTDLNVITKSWGPRASFIVKRSFDFLCVWNVLNFSQTKSYEQMVNFKQIAEF